MRRFVKFELLPLGCLTSTDPTDWEFVLDEEEVPDWFIEDKWRDRCIEAAMKKIIPDWIKCGIQCSLCLVGCTNLTNLGALQSVKRCLYLAGCTNLTNLGELRSVGVSLDLAGCANLTDLGELQSVGDWLDLQGCVKLSNLNKLQSIGSYLYLRGTKVTKAQAKEIGVLHAYGAVHNIPLKYNIDAL